MADSTFINNSGPQAGGLNLGNAGLPVFTDTVANSLVAGNNAQVYSGGGIAARTSLIIQDSVISNNLSLGNGGGVAALFGTENVIIQRSLLYHNRTTAGSSNGGGMYAVGNAVIVNTTVYSNGAADGGGLYLQSTGALTNDTLIGNSATGLATAAGNLTNGGLPGTVTAQFFLKMGAPSLRDGAPIFTPPNAVRPSHVESAAGITHGRHGRSNAS